MRITDGRVGLAVQPALPSFCTLAGAVFSLCSAFPFPSLLGTQHLAALPLSPVKAPLPPLPDQLVYISFVEYIMLSFFRFRIGCSYFRLIVLVVFVCVYLIIYFGPDTVKLGEQNWALVPCFQKVFSLVEEDLREKVI